MNEKINKLKAIAILLVLFGLIWSSAPSFGSETAAGKSVNKIEVKLISAGSSSSELPKSKVTTTPIVVSGTVTIEIGKTATKKDIENQRYSAEYFIDGDLAYETVGSAVQGSGGSLVQGSSGSAVQCSGNYDFSWLLDTTKYTNGKHKLVVNFWDKDGPSAIGVVYLIIDNPVSIEQIKGTQIKQSEFKNQQEVKSGDKKR